MILKLGAHTSRDLTILLGVQALNMLDMVTISTVCDKMSQKKALLNQIQIQNSESDRHKPCYKLTL